MNVTVIDYGLGNLHSVVKALRHEGADVVVAARPDEILRAERLVLPGVGAFGDGMAGLEQRGLLDGIRQFVTTDRPLLGICLGMQLLFTDSEEFGHHRGLNFIAGNVREIPRSPGLKVPHIGWNRINPVEGGTSWASSVMADLDRGTMVYFVHSFTAHPATEAHRLADTDFGGNRISAAVQCRNVVGCQFHPEKSGPAGLRIIRRFIAL